MATTSISQMTTAATVDNGDLFEIAHPDQNSATGYASNKQSLAAIADHMGTAVNYPTMNTTAKTIVGAINELEAGGGGGGSTTLAGLTDVDISSPTNGQTLIYNATSGKWENGSGGGGGALPYTKVVVDTLDDGIPNTDGGGVYYEKYGEIVHLHLAVRSLTSGTTHAVMVLPTGYRPDASLTAIGIGGNVSNAHYCTVQVAADGTVYMFATLESYLRADIVYIVHSA